MPWYDSRKTLEQYTGGKNFTPLKTVESAVTPSWRVIWDADYLAQDLLQYFFAANRVRLNDVRVTVEHATVTITTPNAVHLERLLSLGGENSEKEIRRDSEGVKGALMCLIRDYHIELIAVSRNQVLYIRTADTEVLETPLQPIVSEFFQSDNEYPGTQLILRRCSEKLVQAFKTGMTHFLHEDNPLVGARVWSSPKGQFALYTSTTANGHIFYQQLKYGEIPHIPVVLVINGEYAVIETLIRQDRDRNAFSERLLKKFYQVFVQSGIHNNYAAQRTIVEAACPCWGQGHPLLHTIATAVSHYYYSGHGWSKTTTAEVFGDGYYAQVTARDPARQREYERLESAWKNAGKVGLPAYFRYFGVLTADTYYWALKQQAHEAAKQTAPRMPSPAETASLIVLVNCLRGLGPALMERLDKGRTIYSVAETDTVSGQLKHDGGSLSRKVDLSAQMFAADFPKALAIFLHKHAQFCGDDDSRGFMEALRELLESVVRDRTYLDFYATQWHAARTNVLTERANTTPYASVLMTKTEEELRALLLQLPPAVV